MSSLFLKLILTTEPGLPNSQNPGGAADFINCCLQCIIYYFNLNINHLYPNI